MVPPLRGCAGHAPPGLFGKLKCFAFLCAIMANKQNKNSQSGSKKKKANTKASEVQKKNSAPFFVPAPYRAHKPPK